MSRIVLVGAFLMIFGFVGCGGDSESMALHETFRSDAVVNMSIFSEGGNADPALGTYRLIIVSRGVSSGLISLNGEELFRPRDFHNTSFRKTLDIELLEENTIEIEVRGSPGDQLCVRVYELEEDESERGIFEDCVDRTAGPPNHVELDLDLEDEDEE